MPIKSLEQVTKRKFSYKLKNFKGSLGDLYEKLEYLIEEYGMDKECYFTNIHIPGDKGFQVPKDSYLVITNKDFEENLIKKGDNGLKKFRTSN